MEGLFDPPIGHTVGLEVGWRLAGSLVVLRRQVDELAPNRSRALDGTIGDAAHAARASRHNPYRGVVAALDLTHDPQGGLDAHALARRLTVDPHPNLCLVPGTKVLGADLAWRPIETIEPGDVLIAFDERGSPARKDKWGYQRSLSGARFRTAVVEAKLRRTADCRTIVTDNGTVTSSSEHLWLRQAYGGPSKDEYYHQWLAAKDIEPGMNILFFGKPWSAMESREAGWLGGMLDGEGCLSKSAGWAVTISQRQGLVMDEIIRVARLLGLDYTVDIRPKNSADIVRFRGGLAGALRLVGSLPTLRLRQRATDNHIWDNVLIAPSLKRNGHGIATVQSVSRAEIQEVISLQTSTRTFIADGFCSHNCYIISNRQAAYRKEGFVWRRYGGSHPHDRHIHVAVGYGPDAAPFTSLDQVDDETPWHIGGEVDMTDQQYRELLLLVKLNRVSAVARSFDAELALALHQDNPARYAALKEQQRAAVEQERVRLGLSKLEVADL